MDIEFRKYNNSDYVSCERLVNGAWGFDTLFKSTDLNNIAKMLYAKGSEISSNYKVVATYNNEVIGFIFGFNRSKKVSRWGVLLGIKSTISLYTKKMDKNERQLFVDSITSHHKNRLNAAPEKMNEIVLFVVKESYQGRGVGKTLWQGFRDFCYKSKKSSIRVETNTLGASGFYERLGFRHLVDFDSPLHKLATPDGQACIYEYVPQR